MRKNLYKDLCKKLQNLGIKHVDLWNRNIEFIEQEESWERPAVFIEFGTISWQILTRGTVQKGEGTLKLHIITDWKGSTAFGSAFMDEALEYLDYSTKIQESLQGLKGKGYYGLYLQETYTNHDHEDIIESVEVYNYRCMRELAYSPARDKYTLDPD